MKRILTVLLVLCLLAGMAGCSVPDYYKAYTYYEKGRYAEARELYMSLGDFADSAKMAEVCGQKADYAKAEDLAATGDYEQAAEMFDNLGMYSDSPLRAVECRYEMGKVCLEDGEYEKAIEILKALGGYADCPELVRTARWNWLGQIRHTKVLDAGVGRNRMLSVEMPAADTLRITLEDHGLILGLSYEADFEMILLRDMAVAEYTLQYNSVGQNTITETAAGTVELRRFHEGLPITEFTQTVTDEEGSTAQSADKADAIMMQTVMAEVTATIEEFLPELLQASNVDITVTDLGF